MKNLGFLVLACIMLGLCAFGQTFQWEDAFEDGSIDSSHWMWGGEKTSWLGPGAGDWTWAHNEVTAPDGYLKTSVSGPTSANTYGSYAWIRTQYDYNDGLDHVINFRWSAAVENSHIDIYAIQVTNGVVDPLGSGAYQWFESDGPGWTNLYYQSGQQSTSPTEWSMAIYGAQQRATLFDGPNLSGNVVNDKQLPLGEPWFVRFVLSDATSAGFPAGTNALNLYYYKSSAGDGGGPHIASITPATVEALIPGSAQSVSIQGSGFSAATTVSVDGQQLSGFPPPYTVVNSSLITFDMPQVDGLGSVDITVSDGLASDAAPITVVGPLLPKLQCNTGDEPVIAFSFSGLDVTMSSLSQDLFILLWSPSSLPSALPGLVDLSIGNGFSALFLAGAWPIDQTKAWNTAHFPLGGVSPGTTLFLQGVVVGASRPSYPLKASNEQEVTVLF